VAGVVATELLASELQIGQGNDGAGKRVSLK
jgi:hypothetical protein